MKVRNEFYNKHFVCLSALFILGNGVITAPALNANKFNFLSFLLCSLLAITVTIFAFLIPLNRLTALPIILLSFYCVGDAFITFVKFIKSSLLPLTPSFLIVLPFVLILVFTAFKGANVLFKFSLICFCGVTGVILLFFFATLKDFNIRNIFIYELPTLNTILKQMLPFIKTVTLPAILLPIFARDKGALKGANIIGLGLGSLLFGVCILNSVLLFGFPFAAQLPYPYSASGSTVTFGNLFTRMDGLLYFVYLVTSVIKCVVGIEVIKKSRSLCVVP